MSILSAQTIRRYSRMFELVKPFHERTVEGGMSYGLGAAGYDVRVVLPERPHWILKPKEFLLAATMEHFNMPHNVVGRVHDKSTWARRGLTVKNTIIEPGWRGYLTLELTNDHHHMDIILQAGEPIAQIVFEFTDEPTAQPYDGKYQDQPWGPQKAVAESS